MKKIQNIQHTSPLERFFYGSYFWGQNTFYFIVSMMLQIYLTNNIGLSAAVVGVIFVIVRVWDAVIDPFFGVIIDRAGFKKGKFIPWIRLSAFIIPVLTVLLFIVPNSLSYEAKVIWVTVIHILWGTAYTICDAPITGLTMTMTDNVQERTTIISIGRLGALLAMLGSAYFMPNLAAKYGYGVAVIILSFLAFLSMLPIGYKSKERFNVQSEEKLTMKTIMSYLKQNKYLLIFLGTLVLGSTSYCGLAVMNYVALYCLGGEEAITTNMLSFYASMVAAVPMVMFLSKKIDKFYLYVGSYLVTFIVNLILYFTGYDNLIFYYIMNIIRGVCFGFSMILTYAFVADTTVYGTYKTKTHAEGVSFALQTFSQKMFSAISSSLAMFALGAAGYISCSETGEHPLQTSDTIRTIWDISTIYTGIGAGIITILLILFYKLRENDVKIMAAANSGTITQEEAREQLPEYI